MPWLIIFLGSKELIHGQPLCWSSSQLNTFSNIVEIHICTQHFSYSQFLSSSTPFLAKRHSWYTQIRAVIYIGFAYHDQVYLLCVTMNKIYCSYDAQDYMNMRYCVNMRLLLWALVNLRVHTNWGFNKMTDILLIFKCIFQNNPYPPKFH